MKVLVNEETLVDVADAIREKTGTEETYLPSQMGDAIRGIESGSGDSWYDTFWDAFQENGERGDYRSAFGGSYVNDLHYWTDEMFRPKYDIIPKQNPDNMFQNSRLVDLEKALNDCGRKLDFTKMSNLLDTPNILQYVFMNCRKLVALPIIDLNTIVRLQYTFANCSALKELHLVNLSNECDFVNVFNAVTSLENLTISGVIGKNGIAINQCNALNHSSLLNILNILEDKTKDTSGTTWKVTFGATNIAKLTEAELQIAYEKGWDIA